ncbi:unnamed protein product [Caretta caretta]
MWVNPNLVCSITGYPNKGIPGKPVHSVAPAPKAAVRKPTSVKPRPQVAAALQTSSGQCVSVSPVTAAPKVSARKYSSVKAVTLVTALETSPVASVSKPPLAAAVILQASTVKKVPRKLVFPVLHPIHCIIIASNSVAPKASTPVKPVPPVAAAHKASNRKHASVKTVPPVADTMQICTHTPEKNMSLEAAALEDSYQKPVLIDSKQLCPKEEMLLCSSKAKH